jgi:hypothetical protein
MNVAPAFPVAANTKGWAAWQWKTVARCYTALSMLQDAGFTGALLREMAATWLAESGCKHLAQNFNANGSNDLGPAQLNRMPDTTGPDERTNWAHSAHTSFDLWQRRGFKPWNAYGTTNWITGFPYVDLAISMLEKPDRIRHGFTPAS